MSLRYTLYVHVFVVMGVSDCENFRFGYIVVVTSLGVWNCNPCLDMTSYLLGVEVASWGPLVLTEVIPVGVLLCEVAIFCYNGFRSGGYLWLSNSYTVTVAYLWEVFQIVLQ